MIYYILGFVAFYLLGATQVRQRKTKFKEYDNKRNRKAVS